MSANISVSIYRLSSGRYQLSFFNPVSRKRIRKLFKLISEAKAFEQILLKQFKSNGTGHTSVDPVAVWMKRYLELHPNAFIKRLGEPIFLSFIETYGPMALMNISSNDISSWLKDLQIARNYSPRTLPNIRSAVNQFFQFAVDSGGLQINPVIVVKIQKGLPTRERVVLTEDELNGLFEKLKVLSPAVVFPVLFLLAHTGARLKEILKLRWIDVHSDLKAINFLKTKNGEDRFLHVSDLVMQFLAGLPRTSEYVLLNMYGKPWSSIEQYQKQFTKIRRKAEFPKYFNNHLMRHSFATNYQKAGGDMKQLQKILGHKHLDMTADLYGKIEAKDVKDISPFDF